MSRDPFKIFKAAFYNLCVIDAYSWKLQFKPNPSLAATEEPLLFGQEPRSGWPAHTLQSTGRRGTERGFVNLFYLQVKRKVNVQPFNETALILATELTWVSCAGLCTGKPSRPRPPKHFLAVTTTPAVLPLFYNPESHCQSLRRNPKESPLITISEALYESYSSDWDFLKAIPGRKLPIFLLLWPVL